jgi:N-acetylmuramoyl-L-alanine amidase
MIHLDGKVENLVPYNENDIVEPWEITNGAKGFNAMSRHVVYVGGIDKKGKPKDTRTSAQKAEMECYVKNVILLHPNIKVAGHNQFNKGKACPSFDTVKWLKEIGVNSMNIYKPL